MLGAKHCPRLGCFGYSNHLPFLFSSWKDLVTCAQTNKQKTVDESPELLNVNNKSFICMCVPLVASFFSYSLKILNLIFILYCNTVDLQCVSFRSTAEWFSYVYTVYLFLSRLFSHIGYNRILSRVPSAVQ